MATLPHVRALAEADLPEVRRIFQLAFGTFMHAPDPAQWGADRDFTTTRWRAAPQNAWVAEIEGKVVGSNYLTQWGSFGFFGPLTVLPEFWDKGVARALLSPTVARFEELGVREAALFTFSHSPKHISLYQKFGFWPGSLTALLAAPAEPAIRGGRAVGPVGQVGAEDREIHAAAARPPQTTRRGPARAGAPGTPGPVERQAGRVAQPLGVPRQSIVAGAAHLSQLPEAERLAARAACRALTGAIYPGLDVSLEIEAIAGQQLGETVLLRGPGGLDAFACCHCGPGTEAGNDSVYIKFAAVRPGPGAAHAFDSLLAAVRDLAARRQLTRVATGISLARREAYRRLLSLGFRTNAIGVSMHRPDGSAYNRSDAWILDDWR
jgi:L-amino acid N-acyltransferase YncA